MECACLPNTGPMLTPEPHMVPGYMGYVPQLKFKFGNTYGAQTNRIFLDPCVNMSPRTVLNDICPEDCGSGGFLQNATGYRYGQCGCLDPFSCRPAFRQFAPGCNPGFESRSPRFQAILNQRYAPFCNRFCTRTFEQDQWRDKLFGTEKEALDGWRFCYKSKPWERPDRTKPWDGDHAEFRRTQTTLLPPLMKDDLDSALRGCGCAAAGTKRSPYPASGVTFNSCCTPHKNRHINMCGDTNSYPTGSGGGGTFDEGTAKPRVNSTCGPCDLYQQHMKRIEKDAIDIGLAGIVKHPQYCSPQGRIMRDVFCERIDVLNKLNKEQTARAPNHALEGVLEELGELPIVTLHKIQQKKENASGKFYPDDRGLAEVCNPVGGSYMTARPFRCHPIYRYCEPVGSSYAGHVPGEQFVVGEHRGRVTRNATKYMTYRV